MYMDMDIINKLGGVDRFIKIYKEKISNAKYERELIWYFKRISNLSPKNKDNINFFIELDKYAMKEWRDNNNWRDYLICRMGSDLDLNLTLDTEYTEDDIFLLFKDMIETAENESRISTIVYNLTNGSSSLKWFVEKLDDYAINEGKDNENWKSYLTFRLTQTL